MNKLRTYRLDRGLSQVELSGAAAVSRWRIHLVEQGHRAPEPEEASALASALNVEVEKLFPKLAKQEARSERRE